MENLQNNPWFLLVLTVALSVGIIFFGFKYWPNIVEKKEKIAELVDQIALLKKEVEEGRALQARLPELQREIKAKEDELLQLRKILPADPNVEDLVRKLERLAIDSRLQIKKWSSGRRITHDFYLEWPITVQASGKYHNLAKFYSMLGNYARIVNVANVQIVKAQGKDPDTTIEANFRATTYVYSEGK